ncbi:MAG: Mu transposase C-terminal domain-containing protein [Gammaproteobacteria bacterium]|nr:Mu transposase C-terminal domain-containing protein [Gammaproteobacteria bacterium]
MWMTAQELEGLKTLPKTRQGINKKARREGWIWQKREGIQGGAIEFAVSSLPQDVQAEILLRQTRESSVNKPNNAGKALDQTYSSNMLWDKWEKAPGHQQQIAKNHLACVTAVAALCEDGMPIAEALERVAQTSCEKPGSIKNWYYAVKKLPRTDWLPTLLPEYGRRKGKEAEFTEEAWEFFKADFLDLSRPQFGASYTRTKKAGEVHGWVIPSRASVKRKLEREVDKPTQVLLREGEYALSRMFPSLVRTVENLEAMEWINGDGYQHNVFVIWEYDEDGNPVIIRPKTWFWQDVRTRKILAYRIGVSENTDTIRLSLLDVISRYQIIPKHITLDNTLAAANKIMTGGVKNRYRFKVKEEDLLGIIPQLGIQIHWTSVQYGKGHGQGKPIERAFSWGGLQELIDKNLSIRKFYTGDDIYNKPENHCKGKDGASLDDFILAVEEGVQSYNEQLYRDTEICMGKYSFNQVFDRDYAKATGTRATIEHMRILMLASEPVTLKKDGTFWLKAGKKDGNAKNRYQAIDLIGTGYDKVVVKFDPMQLHEEVLVYTKDLKFLCKAECTEKAGFGDTVIAREHGRAKKRFMKAEKAKAKAVKKMNALEASEKYYPQVEFDDEVKTPSVTEIFDVEGSVVRKRAAVLDDDKEYSITDLAMMDVIPEAKRKI